jgi:hypothetical protein
MLCDGVLQVNCSIFVTPQGILWQLEYSMIVWRRHQTWHWNLSMRVAGFALGVACSALATQSEYRCCLGSMLSCPLGGGRLGGSVVAWGVGSSELCNHCFLC